MIKKATKFLVLFILISCVSTQIISKNDLSTSKEVTNTTKKQKELYITANDWMIDQFTNADSVIQFSDKEAGTIIGKYFLYGNIYTIYGSTADNRIFAKIKITVKDNYAKLEIQPVTDIKISNKAVIPKIKTQISSLLNSFETRMQE